MKQLLVIAGIFVSLSGSAQTTAKPVKPAIVDTTSGKWISVTFTVDSTNWKSWYYIMSAGINNLMKTNLPANEVEPTSKFGMDILQKLGDMYQKRYPTPKPVK